MAERMEIKSYAVADDIYRRSQEVFSDTDCSTLPVYEGLYSKILRDDHELVVDSYQMRIKYNADTHELLNSSIHFLKDSDQGSGENIAQAFDGVTQEASESGFLQW